MRKQKVEREIELRDLEETDIDDLFSLTSDERVAKFMKFETHKQKKEAESLWREYKREGNFAYRFCEKGKEKTIGIAVLKKEEGGEYSISIFSFPEYWNQGYATKVIEKLKEIAKQKGIEELDAYILEENIGSRRVMEKAGFYIKEIISFEDFDGKLYLYCFNRKN